MNLYSPSLSLLAPPPALPDPEPEPMLLKPEPMLPEPEPMLPEPELMLPEPELMPPEPEPELPAKHQYSRKSLPSVQQEDPIVESNIEEDNTPKRTYVKTQPNKWGLFHVYDDSEPSRYPDTNLMSSDVTDDLTVPVEETKEEDERLSVAMGGISITPKEPPAPTDPSPLDPTSYAPFKNITQYHLIHYLYSEKTLSPDVVTELVRIVFNQPDYEPSHPNGFNAKTELKHLDQHIEAQAASAKADTATPFEGQTDVWHKGKISILMPCPRTSFASEADALQLVIEVWHRKLMDVIRSLMQSKDFFKMHLKPYKLFYQQSTDSCPIRVYTEAYTSNRAIEIAQKKLKDPILETIILLLMFGSDASHLANFGTTSLWPIYLWLGNLTKYLRGMPQFHAAQHIMYIPHLPDLIKDIYTRHYGKPPTEEMIRHLRREVIQAAWGLLLDDEFVEAYVNGAVFKCADHVERFSQTELFSYAADYPEKIAVVCTKHLRKCLCIRCLTERSLVPLMGTPQDMKCRIIKQHVDSKHRQDKVENVCKYMFKHGYSPESDAVKGLLDAESLTPIRISALFDMVIFSFSPGQQNVFSQRLLKYGFDVHRMMVVDALHDVELGVCKAIVIHILRVVVTQKEDHTLDQHFHLTPTFGRDTICRFQNNVSQLKKLAARDYEDILQCSMPCFEGLLGQGRLERVVMDLLFDMLQWHAYAKLRMHDDSTVESFKKATTSLGKSTRLFASEVNSIVTKELPGEVNKCSRTAAKKATREAKTNKAGDDATTASGRAASIPCSLDE
uniref:Uncharacterized protein n=1 Tax=Moniliophthora roreri TaxID=221103 RepID=A0A0W0FN43_MONRR